ncbi:hypothetical protein GGR55DRAFT_274083 [Xylaria sp. FL0064]|nr:hypothetical protein GGR55DRAFT_274083 [Xylaria sp. FL0064]
MSGDPDYDAETEALERYVLSIDYTNPANRTHGFLLSFDWPRCSRIVRYKVARLLTSASMAEPSSQTNAPTLVHWSLLSDQVSEFAGGLPLERPEITARFAPDADTRSFGGLPDARAEATSRFLWGLKRGKQKPQYMYPDDIPPTDRYQNLRGTGIYTYGIKLNPFIAATWHSKPDNPVAADRKPFPPGDPHLTNPVVLPDIDTITWQEVVRDVVGLLNATGKLVVIERDEEEDSPVRRIERTFLDALNRGKNYDDADAERYLDVMNEWEDDYDEGEEEKRAPPRMPWREHAARMARNQMSPVPELLPFDFRAPELADECVRGLANCIIFVLTTPGFEEGKSLPGVPSELFESLPRDTRVHRIHEITDDLIALCASGIQEYLKKRYKFTPSEADQIQTRTKHAVQAQVLREQVDRLACNLPQMKPRYRAWSVSRNRFWRFNNVKSSDYRNCSDPAATRPVDMYHWAGIEVSSPVYHISNQTAHEAVYDSLKIVCETLKRGLRTHHCALPTLDGTTSIFISHTEGFTLLELKKLVTLWFVLEPKLRRLHRHHRNTLEGQWTCMPLRRGSRLGSMADVPLEYPVFDPDGIMPHLREEMRQFHSNLMNEHFATLPFFESLSDGDELYLRAVWQYTSVSDLSLAMKTVGALEATALTIRCRGRGQRTSRLRSTKEMIREANHSDIFPEEIDKHRGVLEFRQMGQSLDPVAIMAWQDICSAVVEACRETNSVTFKELMAMFTEGLREESAWDILGVGGAVTQVFGREDRDAKGYYQPRRDGTVKYQYPFYE